MAKNSLIDLGNICGTICILNPFVISGPVHPYHLDESI